MQLGYKNIALHATSLINALFREQGHRQKEELPFPKMSL